jgi:hypothetical protein
LRFCGFLRQGPWYSPGLKVLEERRNDQFRGVEIEELHPLLAHDLLTVGSVKSEKKAARRVARKAIRRGKPGWCCGSSA